jgi:hypothetical protein
MNRENSGDKCGSPYCTRHFLQNNEEQDRDDGM